ncbi:MAG: DEAD/DEAH box helicase [Candidatus Omnitrophica bacterium]|nr:DEAD/DEAH box helicase [Candidatus Omnitrophota bacterium]
MTFDAFGLSKDLLTAVERAGYVTPTPVQAQAIPAILKGRDLIAQSKTGTGKTAAFVLPALQSFEDTKDPQRKIIKVLILVPTRELAIQVADVIKVFGRSLARPPRTSLLLGGLNIDLQIRNLHHGADIAVATPGRLLDLIRRKAVGLASLSLLVVDEADKMFDMGFADELAEVLKALPVKRQNVLFSATLPEKIVSLTQTFMNEPVRVAMEDAAPLVSGVHQRAIEVNRNNRGPLLRHLIISERWEYVLVFVATIRGADMLVVKLRNAGIMANALHGAMTQTQRTSVLREFKTKEIKVLVSTDLMARGIDVDQLSYVVNYDLPRSANDHIHRIGRTARAGKTGVAVSFIGHEDQAHFRLIEKRTRTRVPREAVAGFELTGEALLPEKGPAPVKSHRMSKKDRARALAGGA